MLKQLEKDMKKTIIVIFGFLLPGCGGGKSSEFNIPTAPEGYSVYEQTANCIGINSNLKLTKLAVAYPNKAQVIDCARNAQNYAMFNIFDENDSMVTSISLGFFRMDTPSSELYQISAERAIKSVASALSSQSATFEGLDEGRIQYKDQSLYRKDFAVQLNGQKEFVVRIAAVPNYKSGHGILLVGSQRVDVDRESSLAQLSEEKSPYSIAISTLSFAD